MSFPAWNCGHPSVVSRRQEAVDVFCLLIFEKPKTLESETLKPATNLFQRVYKIVRRIPRGKVATYGQIARMMGMPNGARTVGWAMRACPDNVPWHRVVNAQGKISVRDTEGFPLQRALLQAESVRFSKAGNIDLKKHGWAGK
jgi:methylated-DNA-protein-cysteine methyltransferase-like protein